MMEQDKNTSKGEEEEIKDESDDAEPLELILFQVSECYVYLIPPRKSAASYRADEWDVHNWEWEGALKVINKGEECIIRLEDKSIGELYAQGFLRKGEPHPVEPVIDSSRYFVLRVEDNIGGRLRHAFIGLGFRERPQAYDFQAALYDHMKYLEKKQTAEEMEQLFQSTSAVDYSLKDGETLVLHLKNKAGHIVRSNSSEMDENDLSPTNKDNPNQPLFSIKPPPPPPSPRSPTISNPWSNIKEEISPHPDSIENQSSKETPDDDFGDFQTAED